MSRLTRNLLRVSGGLLAIYGVLKTVAKIWTEPKDINKDNLYIDSDGKHTEIENNDPVDKGMYEGRIKPILDQILSFGGLVVLLPVYAAIVFIIEIDDPGPVFFNQKRIGKDKKYFICHKFRSMKMSTPHDIPTHQLADPDRYITRVGHVLRKTSLDELPQLWDIFRNRMSVIGPRPALWNQEDLIAERERYCANSVMPGLTGLAQIRGRDELEIPDKARIDGEYTAILRKGGIGAFAQDMHCFIGTVKSVLRHDGIVEGGTGAMASDSHRNEITKKGK